MDVISNDGSSGEHRRQHENGMHASQSRSVAEFELWSSQSSVSSLYFEPEMRMRHCSAFTSQPLHEWARVKARRGLLRSARAAHSSILPGLRPIEPVRFAIRCLGPFSSFVMGPTAWKDQNSNVNTKLESSRCSLVCLATARWHTDRAKCCHEKLCYGPRIEASLT